jgi:DNA-binding transcriptional MerR regulator
VILATPLDTREWVSIRAAARATGFPTRTIRFWADAGRIRVHQPEAGAWRRVFLPELLRAARGQNMSA